MSKNAPRLQTGNELRNPYKETVHIHSDTGLLSGKAVHKNPLNTTVPKGLRHELGNVPVPQSELRNGSRAHPDCIQTGIDAKGTLTPS